MIVLRRSLPSDEPAVLRLTARLADFPVPPWRTPEEIASCDHPILRAGLRAASADHVLFVAEETGTVIGFVFVVVRIDYFTHERFAYVEALALAPEGEGRGVAQRLMGEAEGWGRALGLRRIGLAVWSQNARARELYDRLGYQPETIHLLKPLG